MCSCSVLQAENSFYPDIYTHLLQHSCAQISAWLPSSVSEFVSCLSQGSARPAVLKAVSAWCCSACAGDAEVGGRLRLKVTSVPTLLGELISRCRGSNNLLTWETGMLRIACCTFLFLSCKAISKISVSKALLTNMCLLDRDCFFLGWRCKGTGKKINFLKVCIHEARASKVTKPA